MKHFLSILLLAFCFSLQATETNPPESEEAHSILFAEALQASEIIGLQFATAGVKTALEMPQARRSTWICTKCKYRNYDGVDKCGICGKPRHG